MSKKEKREKRKKIRKIVIISIIVGVVVLFHGAWAINRFVKYGDYARAVGYSEKYEDYYGYDDEATYYVVLPFYPTFDSYMSVDCSDDGEYCSMFIYPQLFGGYECGFSYRNEVTGDEADIWFDENFELLKEHTNTGNIEEYEEQIENICKLAYDKWGILEYDKK